MKGRLLVVDDEEDIRDVLWEALSSFCEELDTAKDGIQALELLDAKPYDAILSDLRMPRLNGLELLRIIRSRHIITPFVLFTGFGEKNDAIEALRLGAFDFLEKPVNHAQLIRVVEEAMDLGLAINRSKHDDRLKNIQFKSMRNQNAFVESVALSSLERKKV